MEKTQILILDIAFIALVHNEWMSPVQMPALLTSLRTDYMLVAISHILCQEPSYLHMSDLIFHHKNVLTCGSRATNLGGVFFRAM